MRLSNFLHAYIYGAMQIVWIYPYNIIKLLDIIKFLRFLNYNRSSSYYNRSIIS